jgi:hypothetical protein
MDRNHPAYGDSARYNDVYAEHARIERFEPVTARAIRVVFEEAIAPLAMPTLKIFGAG